MHPACSCNRYQLISALQAEGPEEDGHAHQDLLMMQDRKPTEYLNNAKAFVEGDCPGVQGRCSQCIAAEMH